MNDAAPKPETSAQDKALAKEWLKKIDAALSLRKEDLAEFKKNRLLLRGRDESGKRVRTNLHFANLAAMRPQVYAKDPEFSCKPTKAVPEDRMESIRAFSETAECIIDELLVKRGKLKRRAKRLLTSAYATGVGWLKICWQEERSRDPIIVNQIKDAQDNLQLLQHQRDDLAEGDAGEADLESAELAQTVKGLEAQPELVTARGVTTDFVSPDDMLVLDASVREITDYERAEGLAHRLWMTREKYEVTFGSEAKTARVYREGGEGGPSGKASDDSDKCKDLLAVWEVWEQATGRVFTVCEGEEGYCRPPYSPDWTGKRWYPFFLLAFNEVDGAFMPLSDIELTDAVIKEYNKARDDFERDRKDCLPLNIFRKGGTLTPDDVERLRNRSGIDFIGIDGPGGRPISDDIFIGQLGELNAVNYDTGPARQDMEMLVGGGDAARGSVLKAKTATEAEILSQGLRGRSAERTDVIEDMLSEAGSYVLEMCLRKLTPEEAQEIAGPDAMWPQMNSEGVFKQVTLSVRGGSTGKPDRLQEQDRWTKILPVIEKAMGRVAELRMQRMDKEAEAVTELVRETMRRFDERVDLERFMPPAKEGEEQGQQPQIPPEVVEQAKQMIADLQQQLADAQKALSDKEADRLAMLQKAEIDAQRDVDVARIKAPIEAQAKVEVARITASAQAMVQCAAMPEEASEPAYVGESLVDALPGPFVG